MSASICKYLITFNRIHFNWHKLKVCFLFSVDLAVFFNFQCQLKGVRLDTPLKTLLSVRLQDKKRWGSPYFTEVCVCLIYFIGIVSKLGDIKLRHIKEFDQYEKEQVDNILI